MKENYITLKEAAEVSGYSSDYIGQLIRQGKLPAKKIYSNIAWLTTEDAVLKYIDKVEARGNLASKVIDKSTQVGRLIKINLDPFRMYKFLSYLGILIAGLLFLIIFYIFSNVVDDKIEKRALNALIIDGYSNVSK